MRDGDTSVTLLITFGADHLISAFQAESRGRINAGKLETAPWQGRMWDYTLRDGMRIPQQGEVKWLLPAGAKPYWRGRITSLRYEFN